MLPTLAAVTLAALASAAVAPAAPATPQDPRAVPFDLPSARDAHLIRLADHAGKVVYVDVERTTCPRSTAQAAELAAIRAKYQSRGFEVVTVYDERPGADDPFARALADAKKKGFAHPVALNDGGEFHEGYYSKIVETPSGFLVSRSGSLVSLGTDPLAPQRASATRGRIEALLAEAMPTEGGPSEGAASRPAGVAPATRPTPKPFSLTGPAGSVLKSEELAGRPTVLLAAAPGELGGRLAAVLEELHAAWADRTRLLAMDFYDSERAAALAAAAPSIDWMAPDARAAAALGVSRIPQILFLDANGRVAKRITTFYGQTGIEGAVADRVLQCVLAEAGLLDAPRTLSRYVASSSAPDALASARAELAKSHTNYRVEKEQKLDDGRVLVSDRWEEGGKACHGLRLFVPTAKGLLEIRNLDPGADPTAFVNATRSSATVTK